MFFFLNFTAFSQVIKELWSEDSSDRVVNTLAFKSQVQRYAPRFIGYAQQDAQEFLRYLLEGLHEDVNKVATKPTPISTEIDEKLRSASLFYCFLHKKKIIAFLAMTKKHRSHGVDIYVWTIRK